MKGIETAGQNNSDQITITQNRFMDDMLPPGDDLEERYVLSRTTFVAPEFLSRLCHFLKPDGVWRRGKRRSQTFRGAHVVPRERTEKPACGSGPIVSQVVGWDFKKWAQTLLFFVLTSVALC